MRKKIVLYLQAVFYILAGINHFWHPAIYCKLIEAFLPYPLAMVYISGVAELAGGLGLLIPATRRMAAIGLIVLLVVIFPANIYMALHPEEWSQIAPAILYLRLPLQILFIYGVYVYASKPKG